VNTRIEAGLSGDLEGDPDQRPPLVLLHGLTFDRTMWGPALEELRVVDPGRQVLTLDLPGHGASAAWPSYDVELVAAGVRQAVSDAGLRRPILVGHSMSAVIASVYAARYEASAVINVDQPLRMEPSAAWEPLQSSRDLGPELVTGYWRELLDRPVAELAAWNADWLAGLRAARLPYLVITTRAADPGYQAWLARMLPQARVVIWPGGGHFPHLAHPKRFAGFLAATACWEDLATNR
jgi:pimeloyl-ACP methyl ester carboxylesterase